MTLTEFRRGIGDKIQDIFPGVRVDYTDDVLEYDRLPVPLVTYFMKFIPATNKRPTFYQTTKDMEELTGTVTERIPHDLELVIGIHSPELLENEEMKWELIRNLGRAPCILGVGFRWNERPLDVPKEKWGLYSTSFKYIGWLHIEGPSSTVPLIQRINLYHDFHINVEGDFEEEVIVEEVDNG